MTVFGSTQAFGQSYDMFYDEARELYVGELLSRGGVFRTEGPSQVSVLTEIEHQIREDSRELLRQLESDHDKTSTISTAASVSAGATLAGAAFAGAVVSVAGATLNREHQGANRQSGLGMPRIRAFHTQARGLEGLMAIFRRQPPMIYIAVLGGVKISARNKNKLKKKLIRLRNRLIHSLMETVRQHRHATELQRSSRLRPMPSNSRKNTLAQGPSLASSLARQGDSRENLLWKERVSSIKERLQEKRSIASKGLWAER